MKRVPYLLLILLSLLGTVGTASADTVFTSTAEIKKEATRLGDEAVEVVKAPVDTENYGFLATLAVGGAVGLTYVYDEDIRNKLQNSKSHGLDQVTNVASDLGNPFVHLGVAAAVYGGAAWAGSAKWQEVGEMMGEAAILTDASGFLLKTVIGRGRPYATSDKADFAPFQMKTDYDSMPSLHTASSFALASVLSSTTASVPATLLYYSAATLVGFSRLYQDKHWASDVVFGAALGELCGRVVVATHARGARVALVPVVGDKMAMLKFAGSW